ncbi:MAG TPA: hypothetical protein VGO37_01570 [Steroidobacteraceae bacterium]|jgi:hypothetical protein|nr:hypothetical protein [Steroidobacteraceae bacterium]
MTATTQSESTIPWDGHYHGASAVFLAVLERVTSGRGHAAFGERVLANACEFRAATANGELGGYLRSDTLGKLNEAHYVLRQLGAASVAAMVSAAIDSLERTPSPPRKTLLLRRLEQDLLAAGRSLDESIARYAQRMESGNASNLRRTALAVSDA